MFFKKTKTHGENPDFVQSHNLQPRLYEAGGEVYLTLWTRKGPQDYAPHIAVRVAGIETAAARRAAEWYQSGRQWRNLWLEGLEVCEDLKAFLEASSSGEEDGGDDPTGVAGKGRPAAKAAEFPKGVTLGDFEERKFAFLDEERW